MTRRLSLVGVLVGSLGVSACAVTICALSACTIRTDNTNNNTNTNNGGPIGPSPTPTPTPAPTPTPTPTGARTPDPPPGQALPLPLYGASVVAGVAVDVSLSCGLFTYLDAVVDALRARDTRWGYVCSSAAGCSVTSGDKIAYHATAGPEVTGALGNYVIDIIKDSCNAPSKQYLPGPFEPNVAWSSRGRF